MKIFFFKTEGYFIIPNSVLKRSRKMVAVLGNHFNIFIGKVILQPSRSGVQGVY